jgi:diaminohydroxyphosphoribosylaminopyrimidine deaminase / 5-amino-6-(5-phosphoribosylamino)uracil reductase
MDEEVAWTLLQALPRGLTAPARAASAEGHRLQVHPSGRWEVLGGVTAEARDLLDLFVPLILPDTLVIGQMGQSLDGRIATETGHSHYVTGPEDIRRLHRLRALVDAVVVGAGTVASDDPRLTVREVEGENPVRVVLDPSGRLGPERQLFADGAAHTLVIQRAEDGTHGGAGRERLLLPATEPHGFEPAAVLALLASRGLQRVLVEGGGVTVSRFLRAGVLDRLHITVAPVLIGSGLPSITLDPIRTLEQALRPPCRRFVLGEDVLFDLDLRGTEPSVEPGDGEREPRR